MSKIRAFLVFFKNYSFEKSKILLLISDDAVIKLYLLCLSNFLIEQKLKKLKYFKTWKNQQSIPILQ